MGLFDSFKRPSISTPPKGSLASVPTTPLAKDLLSGGGVGSHHGVPSDVTSVVYDASVGMLAMGTSRGCIKVMGSSGIEILLYNGAQTLQGMSMAAGGLLQVPVQHLLFIEGGTALVAVFRNAAVQVWDLRSRKLVGSLNQSWTMTAIQTVTSHPNTASDGGNYVFLGGDGGIVSVVKVLPNCKVCGGYVITRENALELETSDGIDDEVVSLGVNPIDPSQLLIAFGMSGIVLWDLPGRYMVRHIHRKDQKIVNQVINNELDPFGENETKDVVTMQCATWHPDGRHIAAGYSDGSFEIWSLDENLKPMRQKVNDNGLDLQFSKKGGDNEEEVDLGEGTFLPVTDLKFIRTSVDQPAALVVLGGMSKPMFFKGGGREGMAGSVKFTCAHVLLPEAVAQEACSHRHQYGGKEGGEGEGDQAAKPRRKSMWGALSGKKGSRVDVGGLYKCVSSFAPGDGEAACMAPVALSNNQLQTSLQGEKKSMFGSRRRSSSVSEASGDASQGAPWTSASVVMTLVGVRGGVQVLKASPFEQPTEVALPGPLSIGGVPGDSVVTVSMETNISPFMWDHLLACQDQLSKRRTQAPPTFLRHGRWIMSTASTPASVTTPFTAVVLAHTDGSISLLGLSRDRHEDQYPASLQRLESMNRSYDCDDETDDKNESDEDDDDDDDEEDDEEASTRPNVSPQSTPAALVLSRIEVGTFLTEDTLLEEKSGQIQVTSVTLLLDQSLCCIAVGGQHQCAGQVIIAQLCSLDGKTVASGDLIIEPSEKTVEVVGTKDKGKSNAASLAPVEADSPDDEDDRDSLEDEIEAAMKAAQMDSVSSSVSSDSLRETSKKKEPTSSSLKFQKEKSVKMSAKAEDGWAWRKSYVINAHDTAVRCLAAEVSSNGSVVVAAADGSGAVSVTDTRNGITRLLPCGETRGGLVKSKGGVRDQRIIKLTFGTKTFMASGRGSGFLCIGLACGEVQVLDTDSMTVVATFASPSALASINLSGSAMNLPTASQSGCALAHVLPPPKSGGDPLVLVAAGLNFVLQQVNSKAALATVQLGNSPILAATMLVDSEYKGHLAVAFTSDWAVWLVEVGDSTKPGLKVIGVRQLKPPGGSPPWETAPVQGESSSNVVLFDKKVKAEGGGFAVDDSEAEAGGPGWRCLFSKWGELLVTAHGSSEMLRLAVVDWSTLALAPASGLLDTSSPSGKIDMSPLTDEVNVGPDLRCELPLPLSLRASERRRLKSYDDQAGSVSPAAASSAASPSNAGDAPRARRKSFWSSRASTSNASPIDDEDERDSESSLTGKEIDLNAIFDHFERPVYRNVDTGEIVEGVDISSLSAEERTKLLLQQRGEKLEELDAKMRKLAENSEQYRDNAAKIKEETKKQNKNWPF